MIPTPYLPIAGAVIVALTSAAGGVIGYKVRDAAFQRHLKKDAEAVARISTASAKISQTISTQLATKQGAIAALTQQLQDRTPIYVNAKAPCVNGPSGGADVTVGFARMHDYAARGVPAPADPGGAALGAPAGVGMPALIGTVGGNYGLCHQWKAEVEAWREWYPRQKMVWERGGK